MAYQPLGFFKDAPFSLAFFLFYGISIFIIIIPIFGGQNCPCHKYIFMQFYLILMFYICAHTHTNQFYIDEPYNNVLHLIEQYISSDKQILITSFTIYYLKAIKVQIEVFSILFMMLF